MKLVFMLFWDTGALCPLQVHSVLFYLGKFSEWKEIKELLLCLEANSLQPECQMSMYILINSKCICRNCLNELHNSTYPLNPPEGLLPPPVLYYRNALFSPKVLNNHSCCWSLLQQEVLVKPLLVQLPICLLVELQWVGHGWQSFPMLYIRLTCTESRKKAVTQARTDQRSSVWQYLQKPQKWPFPPKESFQHSGRNTPGKPSVTSYGHHTLSHPPLHCPTVQQKDGDFWKAPCYMSWRKVSVTCARGLKQDVLDDLNFVLF